MTKYIKESDVIIALMDASWWDDNDEDVAYDVLDSICAADVEPVRHGKWLEETEYYADDYSECNVRKVYACSLCGRTEKRKEPYCHCGAKMDGGKVK